MARIITQLTKTADRTEIIASLGRFGEVTTLSHIPRIIYVDGPASAADPIRGIPGVQSATVETPEDFAPDSDHVFAPMQPENTGQMPLVIHGHKPGASLWNSFYDLLIPGQAVTFRYSPSNDGTGVNIYVVDSGVNSTHQEFGARYGSRLTDKFSGDPLGFHGSAVASVAAGANLGVAPGATIYDARCFPTEGTTSSSNLIDGMNDCLAHFTGQSNPGVMNCSFGGTGGSDPYDAVIDACVDAGLPVCVSSGNSGDNLTETGGLNEYWPAENPDAITVGGLDSYMRLHPSANYYGAVDIYAMFQQWTTAHVPDNDSYRTPGRVRGTSFSAPMVAGMMARALEGTTKMTSRAEHDTFRSDFLADYGVEDIGDFGGGILAGAKRLYIPDVTRLSVDPYTGPTIGIPASTPVVVDIARLHMLVGAVPGSVSVRRSRTHVITGSRVDAVSARHARTHIIVEE